ncbi:MAG TPA: FAD-dependent oxidoreductase, partial [Micromonosporaceae bacterium]|nr:FAD-dependent oxidoreductase [Micromonosporaceae bacterium]
RAEYDAVLLACGALAGRDLPPTPGRELPGIHLAMEHLVASNRLVAGKGVSARSELASPAVANERSALVDSTPIDAAGKHVVIIGGGDTAADCLGVAHRQGAASVTQLDLYPLPPAERDEQRDPWPTWPWILRSYPAHEEGGERVFAAGVEEFVADPTGTRVAGVRISEVTVSRDGGRRVVTPVPGSRRVLPADLVLLAIGFTGTDAGSILGELGAERTVTGGINADDGWQTALPGVFVAGDMHRGASLIVWAIAEGRAAAAAIHAYLDGDGTLPAPVTPSSRPLRSSAPKFTVS